MTRKAVPVSKSALLAAGAAFAAVLGLVTAILYYGAPQARLQSATLLQPPRTLPDFVLTDQDGQPFTRHSLDGRWSLWFAGFAACPDVCPTTLTLLSKVQRGLGEQAASLQVVFFSVDPERDSPPRIKQYLQYFDPQFVGVTAPEPELSRVTQAMGIAHVKVPGEAGGYTVDHSAALMLLNPRGEIAAYFLPPLDLEILIRDLLLAMEAGA